VALPMQAKLEGLIGKKVLVEGEVGSGKTTYLSGLIGEALEIAGLGEVVVIDMAPRRHRVGKRNVGGQLRIPKEAANRVTYFSPSWVRAPRIEGKNEREVVELANENAAGLAEILQVALTCKRKMLFINDLTIYLQAGDIGLLSEVIDGAVTFVGTAYRGELLSDDKGSGITSREAALLERVEGLMDMIIVL
jgi:hypothetical protein